MKNAMLTLSLLIAACASAASIEPAPASPGPEQSQLEAAHRMDQNLRALGRLVDQLVRQGSDDQKQIRSLNIEIEKLRVQADVARQRGQTELDRVKSSYDELHRKYLDLAAERQKPPPEATPARRVFRIPQYCCFRRCRIVSWIEWTE